MDWPIREFCKVPIFFRGQKYYLRSKLEGRQPGLMVYQLCPWPAQLHEASPRSVVYDEAYVAQRDEAAAAARRHQRLYVALLPLYPFLGLLWSGFKNRILGPLGFEPGSITQASVVLIFNALIVEGIFVGWLRGGLLTYFLSRPVLRSADWAVMLLLGADSAMRFGQVLKMDVQEHWGFCEWLWPRRHP